MSNLLQSDRDQVILQIVEDVDTASNSQPTQNPRRSFRHWTIQATNRLIPDQPRQGLSDGLNYVFREITPFVEHVNSSNPPSNWLSRSSSNIQSLVTNQQVQLLSNQNQLEENSNRSQATPDAVYGNSLNTIPRTSSSPVINQPLVLNADNQNALVEQNIPEPGGAPQDENQNARPAILTLLKEVIKFVPLVVILLIKFIYDHREGLLTFGTLLITFYHANRVVKDELAKLTNRSFRKLFLEFNYIVCCIFLMDYVFSYGQKYASLLIFIPSYTQPLDIWELLWMLCLADFILKLATIDLKIIITSLPAKLLPFQKRGKVFFFIEASSQLYRTFIPIQPWLYYLLESYQGSEKIMGVLLCSVYMVSKGMDIIKKAKLFKAASLELLKTSNLGVSPNSEQLQAAGKTCPICHEDYFSPIRLNCSHIFCEVCVAKWLDRTQTCPLCRAQVIADSSWRDGSTSQYFQFF